MQAGPLMTGVPLHDARRLARVRQLGAEVRRRRSARCRCRRTGAGRRVRSCKPRRDAEVAAEGVVRLDDARLDHAPGAPAMSILRDQPAHLLEAAGRVLTNSVLVRASTTALPRLDRMRCVRVRTAASARRPPSGSSAGTTRCASARGRRSAAAPRARASRASASSSRGAIQITLPLLRCRGPCVCRMMSSAWSQGTSFRRSVMLPVTVSLVMMLRSVKSAITCSTARTSMFWKLSDSFSPV